MNIFEILLIVGIVLFVGYIFGKEIYRIKKHKPSSECCACKKNSINLVKLYKKKYKK